MERAKHKCFLKERIIGMVAILGMNVVCPPMIFELEGQSSELLGLGFVWNKELMWDCFGQFIL